MAIVPNKARRDTVWMDGRTDGWMDGWADGWMGGWMDGWMDGRTDGWMDSVEHISNDGSRRNPSVVIRGRRTYG